MNTKISGCTNVMKIKPYKTIKDVAKITQLENISIYTLVHNGRLKAQKINGKLYFCNKSLNDFRKSFNRADYFRSKEVFAELEKNYIKDNFHPQSKSKKKRKCKITYLYDRYLNEFPISLKQLLNKGLIEIAPDVKPILYKKSSVINAIKILKEKHQKELSIKKSIEIKENIDLEIENLLKPKIYEWEKEFLRCKIQKTPFNIPKPTLSIEEVNKITEDVNIKYSEVYTYELLDLSEDVDIEYSKLHSYKSLDLSKKDSVVNLKRLTSLKNIKKIGKRYF